MSLSKEQILEAVDDLSKRVSEKIGKTKPSASNVETVDIYRHAKLMGAKDALLYLRQLIASEEI